MKTFLALPLTLLIIAAAPPPQGDPTAASQADAAASTQTGRSVAIDQPQRYWLSDDLSRLFLQTGARQASAPDKK